MAEQPNICLAHRTGADQDENGRGISGPWLVCWSIFVIGLVAALSRHLRRPDDAANWVGIIRDIFIIVLAMEGMLMGIVLIVLVIQLAALINLLQNGFSPSWTTRRRPDHRARHRAVHEPQPRRAGH